MIYKAQAAYCLLEDAPFADVKRLIDDLQFFQGNADLLVQENKNPNPCAKTPPEACAGNGFYLRMSSI